MARKDIDYANYDYDAALAQLKSKLISMTSWKDITDASTASVLIELMAMVVDMNNYYIERQAEESYIDTAQKLSSVIKLAGLVGYTPTRKTSAKGTVRFSVPAGYWDTTSATMITIDKYLSLSSESGISFLTNETGIIQKPDLYVDVEVIQGSLQSLEKESTGASWISINIPESGDLYAIEDTSVEVFVYTTAATTDDKWTEVSSFLGYDGEDEVYTLRQIGDYLRIRFADNNRGRIPPEGNTILIQWIESAGVDGNILQTGKITSISGEIYDDTLTDVSSSVSATNTTMALGGEEEEGIEEVRIQAPMMNATRMRAVTRQDYKAFLLDYPGVLKAEAWGEQEELDGETSNPDYAWRVVLCVVPSAGTTPSDAMKTAIEDYLEDYRPITTWLTWQDPSYIYVDVVSNVYTEPNWDFSDVLVNINTSLLDFFPYGTSIKMTDLGDKLYYSDIGRAIDSSSGVSYHNTEVFAAEITDTWEDTGVPTNFSGTTGLTPVVPESVSFYIVDANESMSLVAWDDGDGNIAGNVTSGSINYITGVYQLELSAAPASNCSLRIRYKTGTLKDAETLLVGDGVTTSLTKDLRDGVIPTTITLTRYDDSLFESTPVASDDGSGAITELNASGITGTIDYTTGNLSITLPTPVASGNSLLISYYYKDRNLFAARYQAFLEGIHNITIEAKEEEND